jgi:hypothetical protein
MDSVFFYFFATTIFFPMTIGLFQLGRPFGVLYALPAVVLISLGITFKKNEIRSSRLVLTAVLGQWLSLLAWIFSRRAISAEESARLWASDAPSIAKAGFPIQAIEIPSPPMGSDVIPTEMWVGVFVNHFFWFMIAFLLARPLLKRVTKARSLVVASVALGFYALVANLALFAVWYD